MTMHICCLSEIDHDSIAFGAKAVNAARLLALGYNVPQGFGLSVHCFDMFCDYNHIDARDRTNLLTHIMAAPFPGSLRDELESVWRQCKGPERPFIVRSSAVEEDGAAASYAGIYESVMNIRQYKDLEEGIKRCWCSCYSARAAAYRNAPLDAPAPIGLLVQEMIDGDKSGVLFTIDPVSGNSDHIVIEAYPGLNFALVEGSVPADAYTVDRQGTIISQNISVKKLKYCLEERSFVVDAVNVQPDRWNMSTLSENEIKRLSEIGLRLEEQFPWRCDIEWTIKDDQIYLLQVRPVSHRPVAVQASCYDCTIPEDVECSLLDRYSEPACTCYLSLLERWENDVYLDFYSRTEGKYHAEKPLLFFFNRVYWNLRYQRMFFDDLPFEGADYRVLVKRFKLLWLMLTGYKRWYKRLPKYEKYICNFSALDLGCMKLDALSRELVELIDMFCNFIGKDHFQFLGLAQVCYSQLTKKLALFCDAKEAIVDTLEAYASRNMTMKSNFELLELAQEVDRCPELRNVLMNNSADKVYFQLGDNIKTREFKHKFDLFIATHGHRGTSCDDLYTPHWAEDHAYVLEVIKQLVSTRSGKILNAPEKKRSNDLDHWHAFLLNLSIAGKNPLAQSYERYKLQTLMKLTAEYMALRENQRYYFDKSWLLLRKMILEVGRRLAERDLLDEAHHIFHLSIGEILATCETGQAPPHCRELAWSRMKVYEKNKKITPPYLIKNSDLVRLQKKGSKSSYKAIGISPGKAVGSVRILASVNDLGKVQQGEIVVVPTFHPSWTPILAMVGGMVMNYGNILSHGAVVAREYRIPVVVFNDMATHVFHEGQWIEVDGSTGRIRVLAAGSAQQSDRRKPLCE